MSKFKKIKPIMESSFHRTESGKEEPCKVIRLIDPDNGKLPWKAESYIKITKDTRKGDSKIIILDNLLNKYEMSVKEDLFTFREDLIEQIKNLEGLKHPRFDNIRNEEVQELMTKALPEFDSFYEFSIKIGFSSEMEVACIALPVNLSANFLETPLSDGMVLHISRNCKNTFDYNRINLINSSVNEMKHLIYQRGIENNDVSGLYAPSFVSNEVINELNRSIYILKFEALDKQISVTYREDEF